MRKSFTWFLSLMVLLTAFAIQGYAQVDCNLAITGADVVLRTDLSEVCDGDDLLYEVVGYSASAYEFAFNYDGDDDGDYTNNPQFTTPEGSQFTLRIRENETGCVSNEITINAANVDPLVLGTPEVEDALCYGENGEITLFWEGGTGPYMFYVVTEQEAIDAGSPEAIVDNIEEYEVSTWQVGRPAGTYWVAVNNAAGCADLLDPASWAEVVIEEPDPIMVESILVTTPVACNGGTGTVAVTVTGGGTPADGEYMVTLNGETVETTNLVAEFVVPAGTYSAEVEDANGCTVTSAEVTVDEPDALTFDMDITDTSCGSTDDGEIIVTNIAGGTAPYTLVIEEDGNTTSYTTDTGETSYTFTGLKPTYYSLTITDAELCVTEYENPNVSGNIIAVQSPEDINFTYVSTPADCYGGDGNISVTATGGTGEYLYSFDNETTWVTTSSADLPAGTYQVWVSNSDGTCAVGPVPVTVTQPDLLEAEEISTLPPTCPGGNDGIIRIEATGGNGGYQYSVDGGTTYYDNNTFALPEGDYSVYIKDAKGCEWMSEGPVTVPELDENIIAVNAGSDLFVECFGGNTGSILIDVVSWASRTEDPRTVTIWYSTTAEDVYTSGTPLTANTDLGAGTYYIGATDGYGCFFDAAVDGTPDVLKVVIKENPQFELVDFGITEHATCFEDQDGIITVTIDGGTPVDEGIAAQYALVNNEAALENLIDADFVDFPTGAETVNIQAGKGEYYVVVRDGCGTEIVVPQQFVVEGYDPVELDITKPSNYVTHVTCYDGTDGSIMLPAATGGTGDLVYSLYMMDNGSEAVSGYSQVAAPEFTGLAAGSYEVVVDDIGGCDGTTVGTFVVNQPDYPVSFTLTGMDISCFNAGDGLATITATGGTAPYEFKIGTTSWQPVPAGGVKNIVITEPGTYTVWVRDSKGCPAAASQEVTITEPDPIIVTLVGTNVTNACDETPNGAIAVSVTGGNNVEGEYEISLNGVLQGSTTNGEMTISNVGAGDFLVEAVEIYGNSCEGMAEVTITQPSTLAATATVTSHVSCFGGADGSVSLSITGGIKPYTVSWGSTTVSNNTGSLSITGLAAGTHNISIEDAQGCDFDVQAKITEPEELMLSVTKLNDIGCTVPGMFELTATGGTGAYEYYWAMSDPVTGHVLLEDLPGEETVWTSENVAEVSDAGTWIVWVRDENGCITGGEEDDLGVPVNEWRVKMDEPNAIVFTVNVTNQNLACYGDENASIEVTNISGGAVTVDPVYTVTINGVEGALMEDIGAGSYTVVVSDEFGCQKSQTVKITQPAEIIVDLVPAEGEFSCAGVTEGYIEAHITQGSGLFEYELKVMDEELGEYVVLTEFQDYNSFLVEVGNAYVINVVEVERGCTATDTLIIEPVDEVLIVSVDDRSCYQDETPTAVITATAEEGRALWVRYQKVTGLGQTGPWSDWVAFNEAEGVGTHRMANGLTYGDELESDGHYNFQVKDEMDCLSDVKFKTFVPVQTKLTLNAEADGNTITATAAGGAVDTELDHHYQYALGTVDGGEELVWQDANTFTLEANAEYVVFVRDYHWCWTTDTLVAGYAVKTVAEVQGEGDASPIVDEIVGVEGTVTAVVAEQGFFMQDASGAGNGVWVAYANAASLTVGDGVLVVGTVAEVDNVTTIMADAVTAGTAVEITPVILTSPSAAQAEMYESVLVTVEGARAAAANAEGQWEIYYELNDSVVVNDWIYSYTPTADNFYHVTGVVNGKADAYMVEPRMAADIVDITATTDVDPVQTVEFKVYPNPFNDKIYIDNFDKLTRVVVNNIAGQRVMDIEYPEREVRTDNLVSGVYLISLYTEDGIVKTDRIVKR